MSEDKWKEINDGWQRKNQNPFTPRKNIIFFVLTFAFCFFVAYLLSALFLI